MSHTEETIEKRCVPRDIAYAEDGTQLSPQCKNCKIYFADRENPPECYYPSVVSTENWEDSYREILKIYSYPENKIREFISDLLTSALSSQSDRIIAMLEAKKPIIVTMGDLDYSADYIQALSDGIQAIKKGEY